MHMAATSPVTTTAPSAIAAAGVAGVQTRTAKSTDVAVAETTATAANEPCWANLTPGKPLPGPEEWRALARRASLFRLR